MKSGSRKEEALAVASISSGSGRLVLPADSPYAREIALEHAERSARMHGRARLEIGRSTWLIRLDEQGRIVMYGSRHGARGPLEEADHPPWAA